MYIKGQKDGHKENVFTDFFNKNKSLKFLLPLLLVSIAVLIIIYSSTGYFTKPASTQLNDLEKGDTSGQAVDVLPQIERVKSSDVANGKKTKDPFLSENIAMILKGVTLYENRNSAIIETKNSVYIVSEGDNFEKWYVREIGMEGVKLVDNEGNDFVLKYQDKQ